MGPLGSFWFLNMKPLWMWLFYLLSLFLMPEPDIVIHSCTLRISKTEAGELPQLQRQSGLHSESEASLEWDGRGWGERDRIWKNEGRALACVKVHREGPYQTVTCQPLNVALPTSRTLRNKWAGCKLVAQPVAFCYSGLNELNHTALLSKPL